MKNSVRIFANMIGVFLTLPMWFYLLYKILEAVHASELMWFIYWAYVPVSIFVSIVVKLAELGE